MITRTKSTIAAMVLLAGSTATAGAQPLYQYYSPYQVPTPPSWSYDPYTSGLAPCPQWFPGDLARCSQTMPPTYGQPDFWPR